MRLNSFHKAGAPNSSPFSAHEFTLNQLIDYPMIFFLSLNSFQTHSENCAFTMKIKNENTSEIVSENTWWQTSHFFFLSFSEKNKILELKMFFLFFFSCLYPSWFALKFKLRQKEINDANHSNTVWWFLIKITIESNQNSSIASPISVWIQTSSGNNKNTMKKKNWMISQVNIRIGSLNEYREKWEKK